MTDQTVVTNHIRSDLVGMNKFFKSTLSMSSRLIPLSVFSKIPKLLQKVLKKNVFSYKKRVNSILKSARIIDQFF
jgi:hypothetical protein